MQQRCREDGRCSASALRPCSPARFFRARTTDSSTPRTIRFGIVGIDVAIDASGWGWGSAAIPDWRPAAVAAPSAAPAAEFPAEQPSSVRPGLEDELATRNRIEWMKAGLNLEAIQRMLMTRLDLMSTTTPLGLQESFHDYILMDATRPADNLWQRRQVEIGSHYLCSLWIPLHEGAYFLAGSPPLSRSDSGNAAGPTLWFTESIRLA